MTSPATCYKAENLDVRFLRQAGLRYHGKAIAAGAQTVRRGGAGPVRDLLGGGHAAAVFIFCRQVTLVGLSRLTRALN